MSIFNNSLFLQDYPTTARVADPVQPTYSQGYGNRVASARMFAPLGHANHADHRKAAASANDPFPLRACG